MALHVHPGLERAPIVRWEFLRLQGFGRYGGEVIFRFHPGLNTWAAPNEAGKSTMAAGLCAVLFGLPGTGGVDRFGTARYRNWHGNSPFGGELRFSVGNLRFRLVRNFENHRISLAQLKATGWVEEVSGQHNPIARKGNALYEERLLQLIGLHSRDLYEATFCVVQPLPTPRGLDGTVQHLLAGPGTVDHEIALQQLESDLRRLTRFTRATGISTRDGYKDGDLECVEAEIGELKALLDKVVLAEDELVKVQREVAQLTEKSTHLTGRLEELERTVAAYSQWREGFGQWRQALLEQQKFETALREAYRYEREMQEIHTSLEDEYPELQGSDAQVLRTRLGRLQGLMERAAHVRAEITAVREALKTYEADKEQPNAAVRNVFLGEREVAALQDPLTRRGGQSSRRSHFSTVPAVLGIGGAILVLIPLLWRTVGLPEAGVIRTWLLALTVVGFGLLSLAVAGLAKWVQERKVPIAGGRALEVGRLAALDALLVSERARLDRLNRELDEQAGWAATLEDELGALLDAAGGDPGHAMARVEDWVGQHAGLRSQEALLRGLLAGQGVRQVAELELRAIEERNRSIAAQEACRRIAAQHPALPTLEEALDRVQTEPLDQAVEAQVRELRQLLSDLQEQKERLLVRKAELQSAQPLNVAEAELRLKELCEKRDHLRREVAAISIALQELASTERSFHETHRDRLAGTATAYFKAITGCEGRRVEFGEDFSIGVREPDGKLCSTTQLSHGTRDQLYLAVRLAVADLVADQVKLPLIFDDPFLNCDEHRLMSVRKALERLSGKRQIILLTHRSDLSAWGTPFSPEAAELE